MNITIVGAGGVGLLCARLLSIHELKAAGFGHPDELGRDWLLEPPVVVLEESVTFLKRYVSQAEWEYCDLSPQERSKGSWSAVAVAKLTPWERKLCQAKGYRPRPDSLSLFQGLVDSEQQHFQSSGGVAEVDVENRCLHLSGGKTQAYEILLWCAPLEDLKIANGDKERERVYALIKSLPAVPPAIRLEFSLRSPLIAPSSSVIYPFRYKDHLLRAIGMSPLRLGTPPVIRWTVVLEGDWARVREEQAKCVRALKRNLFKDWPELPSAIESERIVYLDKAIETTPIAVDTLEMGGGIWYMGPELSLRSSGYLDIGGLDKAIENCRHLEENLLNTEKTLLT